jgi:hypothetical protein
MPGGLMPIFEHTGPTYEQCMLARGYTYGYAGPETPPATLMCWWHALILAVGLAVGGFLSGGVYAFHWDESGISRMNRFTGTVEIFSSTDKDLRWLRLPNRVDRSAADRLDTDGSRK